MMHHDKPKRRLGEEHVALEPGDSPREIGPVCEEVAVAELAKLREAAAALRAIASMARKAFDRGDLANTQDIGSIALAAKILHVAEPALKPTVAQSVIARLATIPA